MIAMRIRELLRSQKVTDKETGELRDVRYSDIVILTRSIKGFADVFTEVLNREGIPTYAGTSEGYFQTQEIGVLLDYLRVLDNRRQDIPLAAVLSSAFAEISDEELAVIRCAYPDKPFFEALQSTEYMEVNKRSGKSWKSVWERWTNYVELYHIHRCMSFYGRYWIEPDMEIMWQRCPAAHSAERIWTC